MRFFNSFLHISAGLAVAGWALASPVGQQGSAFSSSVVDDALLKFHTGVGGERQTEPESVYSRKPSSWQLVRKRPHSSAAPSDLFPPPSPPPPTTSRDLVLEPIDHFQSEDLFRDDPAFFTTSLPVSLPPVPTGTSFIDRYTHLVQQSKPVNDVRGFINLDETLGRPHTQIFQVEDDKSNRQGMDVPNVQSAEDLLSPLLFDTSPQPRQKTSLNQRLAPGRYVVGGRGARGEMRSAPMPSPTVSFLPGEHGRLYSNLFSTMGTRRHDYSLLDSHHRPSFGSTVQMADNADVTARQRGRSHKVSRIEIKPEKVHDDEDMKKYAKVEGEGDEDSTGRMKMASPQATAQEANVAAAVTQDVRDYFAAVHNFVYFYRPLWLSTYDIMLGNYAADVRNSWASIGAAMHLPEHVAYMRYLLLSRSLTGGMSARPLHWTVPERVQLAQTMAQHFPEPMSLPQVLPIFGEDVATTTPKWNAVSQAVGRGLAETCFEWINVQLVRDFPDILNPALLDVASLNQFLCPTCMQSGNPLLVHICGAIADASGVGPWMVVT